MIKSVHLDVLSLSRVDRQSESDLDSGRVMDAMLDVETLADLDDESLASKAVDIAVRSFRALATRGPML
jgi:hypothetical protein